MRKDSTLKQDEGFVCAYCGQSAELMCSKCQETYYCRLDHQRAHWKLHDKTCKSFTDRHKEHLQIKNNRKCQIFDYLSKPQAQFSKILTSLNNLINTQKQFKNKFSRGDMQFDIEMGSTVCVYIRLQIVCKDFSTAQDILHDYFKENNDFLSNTSQIQRLQELQNFSSPIKQKKMRLISGKLRLISTLANLMHELIRNSVDMYEILINHIEKIYGCDSLQLSNIYFYTANYLHFLNQSEKALACFLKAAKIRKEKGGTAYFNVAILLLSMKRKKLAFDYFVQALNLLTKQNNIQNNKYIPEIYENLALIYFHEGNSKNMVENFEKAYFYYNKTGNTVKANEILKLFMIIKKQGKEEGLQEIKSIEFPKQKKQKKPPTNISSKNYEHFLNAEKEAKEDERKTTDWLASFKEMKLNNKEPSLVKYPTKQLEYLFRNQHSKNNEEDVPQFLAEFNNNRMEEGLAMSLPFMKTLSSSQVSFINELNRLLMECKEKAAIFDIVENSNFYQAVCLDRDKLTRFYKLNPHLVRPTDVQQLMQLRQHIEDEQQEYDQITSKVPPFTPKLDLSKLLVKK